MPPPDDDLFVAPDQIAECGEALAHLSYRITAAGFSPLSTEVYGTGDPSLGDDAVFAVRPHLDVPFQRVEGGWPIEPEFRLAPTQMGDAR